MNPPPPRAPLWDLVAALASAAASAPLPPALRAFWALVAWTARHAAEAAPQASAAYARASRPHTSYAAEDDLDDGFPFDAPERPSASPPFREPVGPPGDPGAETVAAPNEWHAARLRAALASRDAAEVWKALGRTPPSPPAASERPARTRRTSLARRRNRSTADGR